MKTSSIFFMVCFALLITVQVDAQIGSIITPSSDSYVEGDFGIGHNNPILPLHVKTAGSSTARFETTGTGGNIVDFRENGIRKALFWLENNDDFNVRAEAGDLRFQTDGNNDRMTILETGNVGVGTDPLARFHVNATVGEMARFQSSVSSKWISFYEGTTRKGSVWNNGDDMRLKSDAGDIEFVAGLFSTQLMEVGFNGNVGVGVFDANKRGKFHVQNASGINDPEMHLESTGTGFSRLEFSNSGGDGYWHIAADANGTPKMNFWYDVDGSAGVTPGANVMSIDGDQKYVGIGTASPTNPLNLETPAPTGNLRVVNIEVTSGNLATQTDVLQLKTNSGATHSNYQFIECEEGTVKKFVVEKTGATAIGSGTIPTGYMLGVDGKAACEELLVELSGGWPDYVFEEAYELKTLEEVEASIKENGHLPGIPSATEVEKIGGIHVGDIQTRTIEKVEELTLYAIDANKKIKELNKENTELKDSLEALIKRIEQLENN